jgi:hypothetical protein
VLDHKDVAITLDRAQDADRLLSDPVDAQQFLRRGRRELVVAGGPVRRQLALRDAADAVRKLGAELVRGAYRRRGRPVESVILPVTSILAGANNVLWGMGD